VDKAERLCVREGPEAANHISEGQGHQKQQRGCSQLLWELSGTQNMITDAGGN